MTVSTAETIISYVESAAPEYPVPFRFLQATDLVVIRRHEGVDSVLDLGADYSVADADAEAGGSITRLTDAVIGATLIIDRATPDVQPTDYVANDRFPAESHERALDRLTLIAQEARSVADRSLRLPLGDKVDPIPSPSDNGGKFLAAGAAGKMVFASGTGADAGLREDLADDGGPLIGIEMPTLWVRSLKDRLLDEAKLFDFIDPDLHADIKAGVSEVDLTSYIQAALNYTRNLKVQRGKYAKSGVVKFTASGQSIEFEDGAWFEELGSDHVGIAVPHGIKDWRFINPGMLGAATTEDASIPVHHTAILINSNAAGTSSFGSATADDMPGEIDHGRFFGADDGVSGWNTAIHFNMCNEVRIHHLRIKGLMGQNDQYGYSILGQGDDVDINHCNIDAYIAGQGRHGPYISYCRRLLLNDIVTRNMQHAAYVLSTRTNDNNERCSLSKLIAEDVCQNALGESAAFEITYISPATSGGKSISIDQCKVAGSGTGALRAKGYSRLSLTDFRAEQWGLDSPVAGQHFHGIHLQRCDDAIISNAQSYTDIDDAASCHIEIEESHRVHVKGGKLHNTGSGTQRTGVRLNAGGVVPSSDAVIDRVEVKLTGGGSWGVGQFENITQNGAVLVPLAQGKVFTDVQTGANKTINCSDGASVVYLDASLTSVLQILPSHKGQEVSLVARGATTLKNTNFYTPGALDVVLSNNDVAKLICFSVNGASSLWEMSGLMANG